MFQKMLSDKRLIVGKSKLEGKIKISGAKNSALRLLAASLLTDETIKITNSPNSLVDMMIHIEMLRKLGKQCIVKDDELEISCLEPLSEQLIWDGPSIRNTLLIFGALLTRKKRARVPLPGGCNLGNRRYDLHIMILEKLGARVWEEGNYLLGEAPNGLKGTDVFLSIRSTGATENAIIAGCLARGKTTVWGPHIRPEIIDLISFLNSMGAKIEIFGQERVSIEGVESLSGITHRVISDNMEAITYLIASVITNGDLELQNFPFENLEVPLIFLRESGAKFYKRDDGIIVRGGECYPIDIATGPYPGINSDMQVLFAVFGICAKGESRIIDLRFPGRFSYVEEFKKMGGNLELKDNILHIYPDSRLVGNKVRALDLRCGAALVLAGLVADGETEILDAVQIMRGYENIDKKLQQVGANIRLV